MLQRLVGKTISQQKLLSICRKTRHLSGQEPVEKLQRARVVQVSELWVYPVKSCRGHQVQSARLTRRGLEGDRAYVIAVPQRKRRRADEAEAKMMMVSQRSHPDMARIVPHLCSGALHLKLHGSDGAGLEEVNVPVVSDGFGAERYVDVWGDRVKCVDQGDIAAECISKFLGLPEARLLRMAASARHTDSSLTGHSFETSLADQFQLLLVARSSVEALSCARVASGHSALSIDRFRPNIVVSGGHPFEEDCWRTLSSHTKADDTPGVHLHCVQPCSRCSVPNVDQERGVSLAGDVTGTLQELRSGRKSAQLLQRFLDPNPAAARLFDEQPTSTFLGVHQVASLSVVPSEADSQDLGSMNIYLHEGEVLVVDSGHHDAGLLE